MKEIIAKESLEYQVINLCYLRSQEEGCKSGVGEWVPGRVGRVGGLKQTHTFFSPQPSKSGSESMLAQRAAVGQLVELGHSVFHKFGRLQDEWVCIDSIAVPVFADIFIELTNIRRQDPNNYSDTETR